MCTAVSGDWAFWVLPVPSLLLLWIRGVVPPGRFLALLPSLPCAGLFCPIGVRKVCGCTFTGCLGLGGGVWPETAVSKTNNHSNYRFSQVGDLVIRNWWIQDKCTHVTRWAHAMGTCGVSYLQTAVLPPGRAWGQGTHPPSSAAIGPTMHTQTETQSQQSKHVYQEVA